MISEEESAVAASVDELVCGRLAQGKAAKDERAGMVSDCLLLMLSLLAYHLNGFEFLESLWVTRMEGKVDCMGTKEQRLAGVRAVLGRTATHSELCENCAKSVCNRGKRLRRSSEMTHLCSSEMTHQLFA